MKTLYKTFFSLQTYYFATTKYETNEQEIKAKELFLTKIEFSVLINERLNRTCITIFYTESNIYRVCLIHCFTFDLYRYNTFFKRYIFNDRSFVFNQKHGAT